ncbi:nucleotidyltransferase [Clostridium perfringens]|nr:nucleotidyltransferase [Clostridium perfringens]
MISKEKRKEDFLKLVKGLDISPTMFKNAKEKYENIGKFLNENGLDLDIYPQGSFSLGTVVRPYRDNKDMDYDLDCICLLANDKKSTSPREVKTSVGEALKSNKVYNDRLQEEWDKCWTLEYSEINGVGFNLDLVPAVREENEIIYKLKEKGNYDPKLEKAIAITNRVKGELYSWATNNPKGYKEWFDSINAPFKEFNREERRQAIFNENYKIFSSIEDIPEEIERSSLQRVIQILKRHRDVYFSKYQNKADYKPISAIITTITASIAESAQASIGVLDLLEFVANEFEVYSKQQTLSESVFSSTYQNKKVIKKENGKWKIQNLANPEDNLADSWNTEPLKAKYFFDWVNEVKKDFIQSFSEEDEKFISILESSLGSNFVNGNINTKLYFPEEPSEIKYESKPWSNNYGNK